MKQCTEEKNIKLYTNSTHRKHCFLHVMYYHTPKMVKYYGMEMQYFESIDQNIISVKSFLKQDNK